MPAIDDLFAELRRLDIRLWLDGDNLRVSAPSGVMTHELQLRLKESKPELVSFLRGSRRPSQSSTPQVRRAQRSGRIPLTFAQEGAWFTDRLQPGTTFNIAMSCRLTGPIDVPMLTDCLMQILARHEALRTTFGVAEGKPYQVVNPIPEEPPVTEVDLEEDDPDAAEAALLSLYISIGKTPFNLEKGPLLRLTVARMGPNDHALLLVIHHSVFDGWSVNLMAGELSKLYLAAKTGTAFPLAPLDLQYADFAFWQREALQGELYNQQLDYWKRRLAGSTPDLQLAPDRAPSTGELFVGDALSIELSTELGRKLRELSQREGMTFFMVLLAAFKVLLMRYGGQEDIVVGTPIANRSHEELSDVIGFFVNLLSLRTDLSGNPTFRELLRRERETCLGAYGNQDLPLGLLVKELVPDRNVGGSPLFQAQFSIQEAPGKILELPLVSLRPMFDSQDRFEGLNRMLAYALPAFDPLDMWVIEAAATEEDTASLGATLHYRVDLFTAGTIKRMLAHYKAILEAAVADPDVHIADLVLVSPEEREDLLTGFAMEAPALPGPGVVELFESRVKAEPDAEAVVVPAEEDRPATMLTYGELNARANRLAHLLIARGVHPEQRVGIALERGEDMFVAAWAVLKSGGAFVALDHSQGSERLEYMIDQAQLAVIVTRRGVLEPSPEGIEVVDLASGFDDQPDSNPGLPIEPDQPAYLVYTSGSTGKPKGVVVTHSNLAAAYRGWETGYDLPALKTHLQMANFAFDVFTGDLVRAHCSGARLVVCSRETMLTPERLYRLLTEYRVDCAEFVPAVVRTLMLYLNDHNRRLELIKLIAVGSDRWSPMEYAQLRMVAGDDTRVVNSYGVAEATIDSCYFEDSRFGGGDAMLPVGRPFPGTELYVLDPQMQPSPVGVPGELYIGGSGVARGYLGRPPLTGERFVPHPFGNRQGSRLYRTGDRARWRADRRLELLGRVDQQIKVRGYRIEPGEVEGVLLEDPDIEQALVVARQDAGSAEKQLVGYLVPDPQGRWAPEDGKAFSPGQREDLRDQLRKKLPDYMIPSYLVPIEAFPLTPNGKVNLRELPAPEEAASRAEEMIPPQTPMEDALANIWRQVLGVETLGTTSDFFALGGHSLKASEIIYRIRERIGIELPLRTVFESPTIRGMARAIESAGAPETPLPPIDPQPREGMVPLAYAQEGAWFIDQLQPGVPFNIPLPWHLRGKLDMDLLERAMTRLIERHEILRTTFRSEDGQPYQQIAESIDLPIEVVDLRPLSTREASRQLVKLLIEAAGRSFTLAEGPMFHLTIFRLADEEQVLLLTVHHIVFDGHSVGILARDLGLLYEAERTGVAATLPAMPIQYADYALWQRRLLSGEFLESQLAYWRETLADVPAGLNLATDESVRADDELFAGDTVARTFSNALSAKLRDLSRREGVTLFILFLAAYKLLLARYTGQEDLVVGSPVANRSQPETANLIGFCVNMLAFRTDLSGNPSFAELLRREREACLGAYSHQELPFGLLVQHLRPDRHLSHSPFFSVGFSLQQTGTQAMQVSQFETSSLQGLDVQTMREELEMRRADVTPSTDLLFLQVADSGAQIATLLQLSSTLFAPGTGEAMMRHFERLLEALVDDPNRPMYDLELLDDLERDRLLSFNPPPLEVAAGQTLHGLFETRAAAHPDRVAVVLPPTDGGEEQSLTYGRLNARANRIARLLAAEGVGPEDRVGICLNRGNEMVAAVLGAMKAGAAYVPIDPAQGPERLAYMLENSACRVVLTEQGLLEDDRTLQLDRLEERLAGLADDNLDLPSAPGQLAYVIYTSGSTGRPKGVMVSHDSLVHAYHAWEGAYGLGEISTHLQMASFSFDVFAGDLTRALGSGGTLVLCPRETLLMAPELARLIDDHDIDCAEFVPAVIRPLMEHLKRGGLPLSLKLAIVGSDVWYVSEYAQLAQLLGEDTRVVNSYGVAEATIDSTYYDQDAEGLSGSSLVPIGRPFPGTRAYVLDGYLNPVPVGAAGELYLAGLGLARGYLGRQALTAERFVPNPFAAEPGERLYRTGDRARHLPDGAIAFLGRADNQIKVRGFRIEPGEIEAAINRFPNVERSLVAAFDEEGGEKSLVAYVVGSGVDTGALRTHLDGHLPPYMVPAVFYVLDHLPLSPSGKVDRRALPDPTGKRVEYVQDYVAPTTELEAAMVRIWGDVLGVERVGIHDNFFALGGHSLSAARLVARVRNELEVDLPLRALFLYPTVAGLVHASDLTLATRLEPEPEVDLVAEAVLASDVDPAAARPAREGLPKKILLTGPTSFLGAFLLRELLERTEAVVYCLVRASDDEAALIRVQKAMEGYGIWDAGKAERIVAVTGNLAHPRMGLPGERYADLAANVDLIVHNASWVNALYPYSMLKATNVTGTEEILRLAATETVKPVHYVSSLSVFPARLWSAKIAETLRLQETEGVSGGYAQTKWVAEQLVVQAGERGLPVAIYRPGNISGDSRTGATSQTWGIEALRWLAEFGSVPSVDGSGAIDIVPVDFVAAALVAIALGENPYGRAFHLSNPQPGTQLDALDAVRRAGIALPEVEARRWAVDLYDHVKANPAHPLHESLPFVPPQIHKVLTEWRRLPEVEPEPVNGDRPEAPVSMVSMEQTLEALRPSGLRCPSVKELLDTYVAYFLNDGQLVDFSS